MDVLIIIYKVGMINIWWLVNKVTADTTYQVHAELIYLSNEVVYFNNKYQDCRGMCYSKPGVYRATEYTSTNL